jgi:hypothetical protein
VILAEIAVKSWVDLQYPPKTLKYSNFIVWIMVDNITIIFISKSISYI